MTDMTPEDCAKNIAEQLGHDALSRTDAVRKYSLWFDGRAVIVDIHIFPMPERLLEYAPMSALPPGSPCGCCGGSGKINK